MNSDKNIVLIGMPGSGKTTVGKLLAERMRYIFCDTDEMIENKHGSISSLFEKGEEHFRKIEKAMVKRAARMKKSVISTGGGVVLDEQNIKRLRKNGIIIFIDRPLDDIINDMENTQRPLIKNGEDDIRRLYIKRYQLYEKYADIMIKNKVSAYDTVNRIMTLL